MKFAPGAARKHFAGAPVECVPQASSGIQSARMDAALSGPQTTTDAGNGGQHSGPWGQRARGARWPPHPFLGLPRLLEISWDPDPQVSSANGTASQVQRLLGVRAKVPYQIAESKHRVLTTHSQDRGQEVDQSLWLNTSLDFWNQKSVQKLFRKTKPVFRKFGTTEITNLWK